MTIESLQTITQNFLTQLQDANDGKKTSLAFLKNYIPTPFVKDEEVFQVLVIGGSVCRNVLMKRKNDKLIIISHQEKEQPTFHTENDLMAFLAGELDSSVTYVALNFAFPVQPIVRDGKLDGILLYGTKEHTFEGLQGEKVGEKIEEYIENTTKRSIHVCVANDTICLLLSGRVSHNWDELACAIVGTGFNAAFFLSEHEAVNLESGGFDGITKDSIDKQIDQLSVMPGMQIFEKQVSGAYLYHYFNSLLQEKNISYPQISSTKSLDDVARGDSHVRIYAQEVFEKSAQLAACQLAGIALYRKSDLVCVMDGSIFWKAYQYKEIVEKTLKELVPAYTITFMDVENSSVMGAAKLIA